MINSDIITFKNIIRLFEQKGLIFLVDGSETGTNIFSLLSKIRDKQTLKDFYFLATGIRGKFTISDLASAIKNFIKEKKYQDDNAHEIMKRMKSGSGSKRKMSTTNQYLDLQVALSDIGNVDCSKITFDEGLFLLAQYNERVEEENRKIKNG